MTELISAQQELEELSEAYRLAKEAEKEAQEAIGKLRPAIMALISEIVREEVPLARKTIEISHDALVDVYDNDPEVWRRQEWPTWRIVAMEGTPESTIYTIEEDDSYVKYEFVVNGYKFGRTLSTSTPSLDVDALVADPVVGENLKQAGVLVPMLSYELDDKAASKYMAQNPNSKKVFEKYMVTKPPTVRLLPFTQQEEE